MVKNAAKTFETNNYKTILLPNLYQNPRFDLVEYLSRNRKQHRVKKRKTGDKNSYDIAEINFETKDGVKDNEEKANVDGENKEHDETKEIESEDVISKDKEEIIVDRSGIAQQDKQKESNKEGKQEGESEKEEPNKESTEEELPLKMQHKKCRTTIKKSHPSNKNRQLSNKKNMALMKIILFSLMNRFKRILIYFTKIYLFMLPN